MRVGAKLAGPYDSKTHINAKSGENTASSTKKKASKIIASSLALGKRTQPSVAVKALEFSQDTATEAAVTSRLRTKERAQKKDETRSAGRQRHGKKRVLKGKQKYGVTNTIEFVDITGGHDEGAPASKLKRAKRMKNNDGTASTVSGQTPTPTQTLQRISPTLTTGNQQTGVNSAISKLSEETQRVIQRALASNKPSN